MRPNSELGYYYRAEANFQNNELDKALEDAQMANRLDQTDLNVYRLLAQIFLVQKNYEEAAYPLNTYLTYQSEDVEALFWLVEIYIQTGDEDNEIQTLGQIIQVEPWNQEARMMRGKLYLAGGDSKEASADFERLIIDAPRSMEANLLLGQAYMNLEEYGKAYDRFGYCEGLAQEDVEKAQAYYWMAQVLEKLDEKKAAAKYWDKLLALPVDTAQTGWREEALTHLNRTPSSIAQTFPYNATATRPPQAATSDANMPTLTRTTDAQPDTRHTSQCDTLTLQGRLMKLVQDLLNTYYRLYCQKLRGVELPEGGVTV